MSSGGGGGSSGTVNFPGYMKILHSDWLNSGDGSTGAGVKLTAGNSITDLIDAAVTTSPYSGEIAFDPDINIAIMVAELANFKSEVDGIDELTFWDAYAVLMKATVDNKIVDETSITTRTTAHAAILDDRLTTEVLPRFKEGMRDINAVQTSSFVIGQSVLEAFNTRDVAEFDGKLRLDAYSQRNQMIVQGVNDMMQILSAKLSFHDSLAKFTGELYRATSVLKKEELAEQLDIDSHDYRWSLELFTLGANVLASISGASSMTQAGPSTAQSVMGGAISGAAVGKTIGGTGRASAIGAIGGALLGAAG